LFLISELSFRTLARPSYAPFAAIVGGSRQRHWHCARRGETEAKNKSGSRVVIRKIALCIGFLALGITAAGAQQPLPPPYPAPVYPGAVYPGYPPGYAVGVPPYEVVAIVRSAGFEPLTRPFRNGPAYVLRAVDPAGQEVRVIVDARFGQIARVVPLMGPRYGLAPPPYGNPPPRIVTVPDGHGPNSRIAALPPGAEGPPTGGINAAPPPPHGSGAAPHHPSAQASPPPLPRPRPKIATAETPAAKPDAAPQAAPSQNAAKDAGKEPETTAATSAPAPAAAPAPVVMAPPETELHE
jgi:hypothetical protein